MISPRKEIYINSTLSYCTECGGNELARIVAKKNGVFMERLCTKNGVDSVRIAADYKWYMDRATHPQSISNNKNVIKSQHGCPFDCGICEWHSGSIQRAIIPISNDFHSMSSVGIDSNDTNRPHYKNIEEIKEIIKNIKEKSKGLEIISLTGNETLLHPNLLEIIELFSKEGFKRITLDTNGLNSYEDHDFIKNIKQSNVQLVISLDTFDKEKSIRIHGIDLTDKKLHTLHVLESLQIPTNILLVYFKGINDEDIPGIVQEYIKKDFVRNIIIQNKTFLGRDYSLVQSSESFSIDDVEKLLSLGEDFSQEDFSFLASYHSLCYSVAYYIVQNQKVIPLAKILNKNDLIGLSESCCQLIPDKDFSRNFWDGVNRLWSHGEDYDSIKVLKQFMKKIFPSSSRLSNKDKWESAGKMIKAVYIHKYMGKADFDIDRVSRCGDIFVDGSGRLIPVCSNNIVHK